MYWVYPKGVLGIPNRVFWVFHKLHIVLFILYICKMDADKRLERVIKDLNRLKDELRGFHFCCSVSIYNKEYDEDELITLVDKDISDDLFYEHIYSQIDLLNDFHNRGSSDIDNYINNN